VIRLRRLVTRALFRIGRTASGVSSLFDYLAVSTLELADLRSAIRRCWQDFLPCDADIAAGLMPWEEDVVERFVQPAARVLVIGSGSGRDLIALAERGYQVTGVEPADSPLRSAQRVLSERRLAATLIEGFFEDAPLSGEFDVAMFSYYCYSYIPESHRRVGALRKAAEHLAAGGHILVSYPILDRPRRFKIRLARMMGALCASDWRIEAGDLVSVVRTNGPIYDYAHAFQPGEIEKEAAAAGVQLVYRRDFPDGAVVVLSSRARSSIRDEDR
jgi:SAM-dependent methyltransferase